MQPHACSSRSGGGHRRGIDRRNRAEVIEAVATRLVEAAGPPLPGDPVRIEVTPPDRAWGRPVPEPRWTTADMAGAMDRGTEALLAPAGGKPGIPLFADAM